MDIFGKKKARPAAPQVAPAPGPREKGPEAPKAAYEPKSTEEIHEVEKNIDFFLERKSTLGVMERYKEKYGEDLPPPEVIEGVRYKYDFLEEAEEKAATTDKKVLAEARKEATTPMPTAPPTAPAATPVPGAPKAVPGEAKKPVTAGLSKAFAGLAGGEEKEAPKARPAGAGAPAAPRPPPAPVKPGALYSGEERPIKGDSIALAIFAGKPMMPYVGLAKYKLRNPPAGWLKAVLFILELPLVHIPGIIIRGPGRLIYEAYKAAQRRGERKMQEAAEMEERRRIARERRLAAGGPVGDGYDDYYEDPQRKRPPMGRKPPPPRNGRRKRPMRA